MVNSGTIIDQENRGEYSILHRTPSVAQVRGATGRTLLAMHRNPVTLLQFALHRALARYGYGMTHYRHPLRRMALQAARTGIPTATTPLECAELWGAARATGNVPGDIAEAGVYRGGTAAILLQASAKHLHLFDTFSGLPDGDGQFAQGDYAGSVNEVTASLRPWEGRFTLHQGFFPDSATGLESLRFAFVHLDLDLYESTRAALTWFWPRLSKGGILLSHDYPFSEGVVRAFDEFAPGSGALFLPLSGNQCILVKLTAAGVGTSPNP